MLQRLKKSSNLYLLSLSVLAIVFLGIFFSKLENNKVKVVNAESVISFSVTPWNPQPGDVLGYAWGATTEVPDGGVGWINFSCKTAPGTNPCSGPAGSWGVTFDMSHSGNQGKFSGYAWSNNYGWLSFQQSDVSSCFARPQTDPQVATLVDLDNTSQPMKVIGWGKFISAPSSAGWDGCVSFTHVPPTHRPVLYKTAADYSTGDLSGFAWGGDVTGWISFDCNGCNTEVVIDPTQRNLTFWSDSTSVPSGGGTTLRWQSTGNVTSCNSYRNSSNYPHWKKSISTGGGGNVGGGPSQPSSISTNAGNLPSGAWAISGITQDTTYELMCTGPGGDLPTRYVTITVQNTGVCTDPTADNVGEPLPCQYTNTPPTPTLQLLVSQPTLIVGSGNYDEVLTWTSNVTTLHACVGSFFKSTTLGTNGHALTGWTAPGTTSLPSPNVTNYLAVRDAASGPNKFATLAGAISNTTLNPSFTFSIMCHDSANGDNPIYATAVVNMIDPIVNEPPLVQLWIQDPPTTGTPNNFQSSTQIPPWNTVTSSGGFDPVTLKWQELNVVPDSCVGDSEMYIGNNATSIGPNADWDNVSLPDQGGGYGQLDLNITTQSIVHKTKFQIKCHPLDNPTTWVSAQVCMGISGEPFPQCSSGNSLNRPPSYKEI